MRWKAEIECGIEENRCFNQVIVCGLRHKKERERKITWKHIYNINHLISHSLINHFHTLTHATVRTVRLGAGLKDF